MYDELIRKTQQCATLKDFNFLTTQMELKVNSSDINESLQQKATKASVQNALQRKANKQEVDSLLEQKADLNDLEKLCTILDTKIDQYQV